MDRPGRRESRRAATRRRDQADHPLAQWSLSDGRPSSQSSTHPAAQLLLDRVVFLWRPPRGCDRRCAAGVGWTRSRTHRSARPLGRQYMNARHLGDECSVTSPGESRYGTCPSRDHSIIIEAIMAERYADGPQANGAARIDAAARHRGHAVVGAHRVPPAWSTRSDVRLTAQANTYPPLSRRTQRTQST